MLIDYNMSAEYCSDWSPIDAIREMVQNAIDSGEKYECSIENNTIKVITYNTELPLETLMLGHSIKSENAIGKYGEGYKIGMLVLSREGLDPIINTGDTLISGAFIENQFGVDTFNLVIEDHTDHAVYNDNIKFICSIEFSCSIGNISLDELKSKIPAFTGEELELPTSVDIWQHRPGEIFVNGLWVTNSDLVFGYNFSPDRINLNRDRNMVDGVHWQLAEFYAELGVDYAETIFNLIEQDAPDVSDLSYRLHDTELKAELARLFYNKYGEGAKIAKPGTSYYGGGFNISVGSNASMLYSRCGIEEAKKTIDPDSPEQVLIEWMKENKSKLRRDVRVSLEKLITRAKGWNKSKF